MTGSRSRHTDQALLHDIAALLARERASTARLLADIAEFEARRLHVSAGYPSMEAYCIEELRLDEDDVPDYVEAARTARRFAVIFAMVADGRLHVRAVVMLAPHLTAENADELLAAATHRSETAIAALLARRARGSGMPPR